MTERDAWGHIYRLYEKFAPALRQAATLDDDNELAGKLFVSALEELRPRFADAGEDCGLILMAGYDILDEVFKKARKRAQERMEAEGRENLPPSPRTA